MGLLWMVAVSALVLALAALAYARHQAQKLAQITELYWQLKFDHGELKAKVAPPPPVQPAAQQTFVSLTSLRSTSTEPAAGSGSAGST